MAKFKFPKMPRFKFESLTPVIVGIFVLYIILHCMGSKERKKKQAHKFAGVVNTLLLSRGRHVQDHHHHQQHVDHITDHVINKATQHVIKNAIPQVVEKAHREQPQKVYVPVREVHPTPTPPTYLHAQPVQVVSQHQQPSPHVVVQPQILHQPPMVQTPTNQPMQVVYAAPPKTVQHVQQEYFRT
jgi:hypothetical protein